MGTVGRGVGDGVEGDVGVGVLHPPINMAKSMVTSRIRKYHIGIFYP